MAESSNVEEVAAFEYTCTPMFRKDTPIRSIVVTIYARNREEADHIFYGESTKFFENDINMSVRTYGKGYRQT